MRKFVCCVLALMSIFAFAAGSALSAEAAETKYYTIGGSPATASMYPYWVAIGKAIQTVYPEYQITVSESRGATDVSHRIRADNVILGNSVARSDYENYHGIGDFKDDPFPKSRMLWYYDMTYYAFAVSKESGIKSYKELEGKRINTGGTGSTLVPITIDLMETLGVNPIYYDSSKPDAGDAYANRQIVGMCSAAAQPDSFIMQLNASLPVNLLSLSDEEIAQVLDGHPYHEKIILPANTYNGVDYDVQTIAYPQGSQSTSDLPQEDGYKFVKAVFEDGKEIWASTMPTAALHDPIDMILRSSIPIHAGMVQYIKEKGRFSELKPEQIPPEYVDK